MKTRDRTMLMVVGLVALVGAFFFLAIKPKRADIKSANAKISAAQTRLTAAQKTLTQAQAAKASYATDYARVVRLGKAVPVDQDVPSLVYQLQQAATHAKVSFDSVTSSGGATPAVLPGATTGAAGPSGAAGPTGASGSSSSSSSSSSTDASQTAAAGQPAGTEIGPAALMTMPFDFQFSGRFLHLQDYFGAIDQFTKLKAGGVTVRGRLLTLDSFDLSADQNGGGASGGGTDKVSATVHATAYLAPPDQLASGVPGASVPSTTGAAGTTASGTASSSSPTPTAATGAP